MAGAGLSVLGAAAAGSRAGNMQLLSEVAIRAQSHRRDTSE